MVGNRPTAEIYLKVVHPSSHHQLVIEVLGEGVLVLRLCDYTYHLIDVSSLQIRASSLRIHLSQTIYISCTFQVTSVGVTIPCSFVTSEAFLDLWGILGTSEKSFGRSHKGFYSDRTGGSGYQPSLFLREVRITYFGFSVLSSISKRI